MTSKISILKLIGEDLKKRLWLIILAFAVSAVAFPISLQIGIQSVAESYGSLHTEPGRIAEYLRQIAEGILCVPEFGGSYIRFPVFLAICIGGGALSAVTGFAYIHSREKTDFYHSFAVRREKIFTARWLSGYIICVIPYVAAVLIGLFVVLPVNGLLDGNMIACVFSTIGLFLLAFGAVYAVCVLAMVLTGRILTGLFMMVMLLLYTPALYYVLKYVVGGFYPALSVSNGAAWVFYTSPATLMSIIGEGRGNVIVSWILLAVFFAGGFGASLIIYKFRASETAGRSMTFTITKSIIKVAAVVLCSICAGMFGSLWYGRFVPALFILISLIIAFLLNLLVEFFYGSDLAGVFKKWTSMIVAFGLVTGVSVVLLADPFGINRWMPEKNDIESMAFCARDEESYFGNFMAPETGVKKRLETGELKEFDDLYGLVEDAASKQAGNIDNINEYKEDIYIRYTLKDGSVKDRRYMVDYDSYVDMMEKLSESEEFREKYYPTAYTDLSVYRHLFAVKNSFSAETEGDETCDIEIDGDDAKRLAEVIKEDSLKYSLKELGSSDGVIWLHLSEPAEGQKEVQTFSVWGDDRAGDMSCSVCVYPQYEKTLAFLKEKGINI